MAERTGFEPATPGVTGRYSNQLNYRSEIFAQFWWVLQGSNLRPTACKAVALPTELNTQSQGRTNFTRGLFKINICSAKHQNRKFVNEKSRERVVNRDHARWD